MVTEIPQYFADVFGLNGNQNYDLKNTEFNLKNLPSTYMYQSTMYHDISLRLDS